MKSKYFISIILMLATTFLFAQKQVVKKQTKIAKPKTNIVSFNPKQDIVSNKNSKQDSTNFSKLKIKVFDQKSNAYYPKGDMELFSLIAHELKYTAADIEKKIDGKVLLRFDVDADSTVKEVRVIKDPCVDCGKDIVKIFEKLKFVPATTSKGVFVRTNVMMEIPVWAH